MRLYRACGAGESSEAGVAVIEFALVLPILLAILIGIIEFGKAFNYWIDETQLASSGARWAVVNNWPGKGTTSLSQYIQQQADTSELKNGGTTSVPNKAKVCITFPNGGTPATGDPVKVTVSVTYNWMPFFTKKVPVIGKVFSTGSQTITGSSTMRLEAAPPLGYSNNECSS